MRLEFRSAPRFLITLACLACLGACASNVAHNDKEKQKGPPRLSAAGQVNLGLAERLLGQKQPERAMEHVNKALNSDPDAPEVQLVLARLQQAAGDERKAEKSYARALKLAPNSGMVLNAHGVWLCERAQYDAADADFARAQRDVAYTTPQQAIANAGRCAQKAGRWAKAEQSLRHALEFSPDDPQLLFLLADVSFRQGKLLEARAFVQRRESLGADAPTLALAARVEAAAGDRMAEARYRELLRERFPAYVPSGEGAAPP
jgi:type IV pilus assembly protein PilF